MMARITNLRQALVTSLDLPIQTRKPLEIIHSSIARYREEMALDETKDFVSSLNITTSVVTSESQLIKERKIYVQGYEILERFD